jgi:hypothetical protein
MTSLMLPEGTPPELTQAIQDATRKTLARDGIAAFTMPRHAAVAHEAGHAIVGAHEGFAIRRLTVFSRPVFGLEAWGGFCAEAGGAWTFGPDSSVEEELRRARFIIAGLAGEAFTGTDKPGSSLDELALSQLIGANVAFKLDDDSGRSDAEYRAYAEQLWDAQIWRVAIAILTANREPFMQIVRSLEEKGKVAGKRLRKALAQVRRITQ